MMTSMVTLIQIAEQNTMAARQPASGRVVPHHHPLLAAARRQLQRLTAWGFRSRSRISSVSVPGVDLRSGRSSSV